MPAIAVLVAAGLVAGLRAPARASAASGLHGPVSYLLGAENSDGGFGAAPGQSSNPLYSGWAALGLASAGHSPARLARGSHGLLDYVRSSAGSAQDIGSVERTILVLGAGGLSARNFAGRDPVATLEHHIGADGSVAGQVNLTSFAVLALRAARVAPSPRTLTWLVRQPNRDGGFGFAGKGSESDVDDTGATLEALAGARVAGAPRARSRAVAYLRRQQDHDGGFPSQPGGGSNAQSTAWAIQGLDAIGGQPGVAAHRRRGLAAGLPARLDRRQREHRLLAGRAPDAGVGDRRGADGAGGKAAPAGGGPRARRNAGTVAAPAGASRTHEAASSDAIPWLAAGVGVVAAVLVAVTGLGRGRRRRV